MLKSYELAAYPVHCSDKKVSYTEVESFGKQRLCYAFFSGSIQVWVVSFRRKC